MTTASSETRGALADVADKIDAGVRLSFEDGVRLYRSHDIHAIGRMANRVRERLHGRIAYYNVNRHINYTNYCILRCKFCSFYRPYPKSPDERARTATPQVRTADGGFVVPLMDAAGAAAERDAYEFSIDEIVAQARQAYEGGATEVHIVGGLHPTLPFSYYTNMCAAIRAACPRMHIKAFTAIEIIHFTRISRPRRSIREVLVGLRDAGLASLPGGGAEIFDDRVHDEAFTAKVGERGWFDVHRTAHEMGLFTNATMLYGHVERPEERIAHLVKLREHQDESLRSRAAHFNCCIPLSFIPEGSALAHLPGPTGLDDLKTLAISRLMLDNVPHIKAFWIMQSAKLAQLALNWGCDDFDGTVVQYDITKREGRGRHQELTVDRLKRLIAEAGCIPVERDTLYRRVLRNGSDWTIA
ncbi:MAG: CofH family radical SAM protein [Phycisphaerae bacterium]|nr:CofH family radical SAM protein [Phycisphaerae bacterium]